MEISSGGIEPFEITNRLHEILHSDIHARLNEKSLFDREGKICYICPQNISFSLSLKKNQIHLAL